MSNKTGRNDPCPCGSGKKYKRCCLIADEAAAREGARQQAFDDDAIFNHSDVDEDDDPDGFFDLDDDGPLLDVSEITRVCYTRGVVGKLSDLRAGRGVRVSEWEAPHIPQPVLDSIAEENLAALYGDWGDPKSADPIQVAIIDLETDIDVISVEVFNLGILLSHDNNEDIQRIHRVCGVLDGAAPSGVLEGAAPNESNQTAKQHDGSTTITVIHREQVTRARPATFDLSDVLKGHRRQGGVCALCGEPLTRRSAQKHLAGCGVVHDVASGPEQRLVHIRATSPVLPAYWLDVEVSAQARLEALDTFLRQLWVECCSHLSMFRIGAVEYFSRGYDFGFTRAVAAFRSQQPAARGMSVKIGDALPSIGERFSYEYDFGSTTNVELKAIAERTGRPGRSSVRLLARNTPPFWPCAICGELATALCAFCFQEEGNPFVCRKHRRRHACGEHEGLRPVVNSPRMGVCGYSGEA